jgi:hypothetical protein
MLTQETLKKDHQDNDITAVLVKKQTRETLRQIGHKHETYDQIINHLIKNSAYKDNNSSTKNNALGESGNH